MLLLDEDGHSIVPSRVQYDAGTVQIDLSDSTLPASLQLIAELHNNDSDSGSRVVLTGFSIAVDDGGTLDPRTMRKSR